MVELFQWRLCVKFACRLIMKIIRIDKLGRRSRQHVSSELVPDRRRAGLFSTLICLADERTVWFQILHSLADLAWINYFVIDGGLVRNHNNVVVVDKISWRRVRSHKERGLLTRLSHDRMLSIENLVVD